MSKTPTRPYIVTKKANGTIRLVDATSPSVALSHVARDENTVERASAKRVAELMSDGNMLEYAGTEYALGYTLIEGDAVTDEARLKIAAELDKTTHPKLDGNA